MHIRKQDIRNKQNSSCQLAACLLASSSLKSLLKYSAVISTFSVIYRNILGAIQLSQPNITYRFKTSMLLRQCSPVAWAWCFSLRPSYTYSGLHGIKFHFARFALYKNCWVKAWTPRAFCNKNPSSNHCHLLDKQWPGITWVVEWIPMSLLLSGPKNKTPRDFCVHLFHEKESW